MRESRKRQIKSGEINQREKIVSESRENVRENRQKLMRENRERKY